MNNPRARAGYSLRPLIRKLGLAEGDRAIFSREPDDFRESLGDLPAGVKVSTRLLGERDYIHLFSTKASDLTPRLEKAAALLDPDGMIWISWPKKSSGVPTDLDGGIVRKLGQAAGLVDVKVCAVDETWSGHKFVFRKEDRPRLRKSRAR